MERSPSLPSVPLRLDGTDAIATPEEVEVTYCDRDQTE